MKVDKKIPAYCPVCGAKWKGGPAPPGEIMKVGLRSYYDCGCIVSLRDNGTFNIRGINDNEENI